MMTRPFQIILILLLTGNTLMLSAQSQGTYKSSFENGKELMSLGRYSLAMQALKPLAIDIDGSPYGKTAAFYYALSAYYDNQKALSKDMLLQLSSKYPEWTKIDEVNLWLTNIYFQENEFEKALTYASRIKSQEIFPEATKLKRNHLSVLGYEQLENLLGAYPSDAAIAEALADKIIAQPINEQDRDLLENIVSVYNLDSEKYRVDEKPKSIKKPVYQVAVMLPFMKDELKSNAKHLSNEFVIELYEGILMAVNDLRSRGVEIKLNLYDTKKSGKTTTQLLELEEIKHMDLIIGPLYPEPVKIVSEFAYKYQINMINPLSTNSEIVGSNPYAFLFMPTYEVQAKHMADYMSKIIKNKNTMIFYGTSDRDSVLAYAYKNEIENRGFTVSHIEAIPTDRGKKILDILTNSIKVEFDESELDSMPDLRNAQSNLRITERDYMVIRPDSIGHLFLASSDPALVANTITGLETRRDTIILVGPERWLDHRLVSLSGLSRLKTHLIAPTWIDKSNPKYEGLKALYKETFKAFPSKNVYTGYEVMMTAGKLFQKSGNLFQFDENINNLIKGEIYLGLKFGEENCNQVVPIVKFDQSKLVLVDPK